MDLAIFIFVVLSILFLIISFHFFKTVAEMQPLTALRNYALKASYDRKVKSGKIKIAEEIVEYDDLPADVQAQVRGVDPNKERPFDPFDRQVASCHLPLVELLQSALWGFAKNQTICSSMEFDWFEGHEKGRGMCCITMNGQDVNWIIEIEKRGNMDFCRVSISPSGYLIEEHLIERTGKDTIVFWDFRFANLDYAVNAIVKELHKWSSSWIGAKKMAERQERKNKKRREMESNKRAKEHYKHMKESNKEYPT